jgi:hypothetical protein
LSTAIVQACCGTCRTFFKVDLALLRSHFGPLRASYENANYERLVEIKAKYDPSNMFRLNQNIRPSSD